MLCVLSSCPPLFYIRTFSTYNKMQTFPDNACRREILNLDVYCTNAANGCSWVGKLKQLDVSGDVPDKLLTMCSIIHATTY